MPEAVNFPEIGKSFPTRTNHEAAEGERAYVPSAFLAAVCPRRKDVDETTVIQEFTRSWGSGPELSIDTGTYVVHLACSSGSRVALDRDRKLLVLLHGEIYEGNWRKPAEWLKERFEARGFDFVGEINGSCSVFVVDGILDKVAVITDRINSRRVYHRFYNECHWIGTSLYRFPINPEKVDPVAVACLLANDGLHRNRTLFKNILSLGRASLHVFENHGVRSSEYWTYQFTNEKAGQEQKALRTELWDILVESVRKRITDTPNVFVSLSGGYDSAAVLGVLRSALHYDQVKAYSYWYGVPGPGTDAHVAAQIARSLGCEHKVVQSYCGDLKHAINHDAYLGQGIIRFRGRGSKWQELANLTQAKSSAIFVGDEIFGSVKSDLRTPMDALNVINIRDFSCLQWLRGHLPGEVYRTMRDGLTEDTQAMITCAGRTRDLHELKDCVYLDQLLPNFLLAYREFINGHYCIVRNPFLDYAILDFMKGVPSSLRGGKALYRETVRSMLPEVFVHKRSGDSFSIPHWRNEIVRHADLLREMVSEKSSPLDEVIPADTILRLLSEIGGWRHSKFGPRALPWKMAKRAFKKKFLFADRVISGLFSMDCHEVITRTLCVREALIEMKRGNAAR